MAINRLFTRFAAKCARFVGSPWAFLFAFFLVVIWAMSGPFFGFSDTWELVINTATTIITFLMVFLIQNTQNRDAQALHLKLDTLIAAIKKADNDLIDCEELSTEELGKLMERYRKLHTEVKSLHTERSKKKARKSKGKTVEE